VVYVISVLSTTLVLACGWPAINSATATSLKR
jgi:hypothetical protein